MTVPVQIPVTASTANGLTTVFPYGFMIADEEDLAVTVDGVRLTSGYTVSGVGNPAGGDVTITPAPENGARVVRYLDPVLKRETDYQQFGDWMAAIVNLDVDRIWLALQYLKQNDTRSLKLPVDTTTDQTISESAEDRASTIVGFDGDGNMTLLVPADLSMSTVTVFMAGLLEAGDAAAARATLQALGTTEDVTLSAGKVIVFEGATDDAHETTLTATDPTADRTIALPNQSGTAALLENIQAQDGKAYTTGGTGTAFTLTPTPAITALAVGQEFDITFSTTAGTTPTLAVSGLDAKSLMYRNSAGIKTAVTSTQIPVGWRSKVVYDGTDYIVREVPPQSSITWGTSAEPTSGTYVDFTGIPSNARVIFIPLSLLQMSATAAYMVQIGDSDGIENSGYTDTAGGATGSTLGFQISDAMGAQAASGCVTLVCVDPSTNTWLSSCTLAKHAAGATFVSSGTKSLSATLDRVRFTTVAGTATCVSGKINVGYLTN